MVCRRAPDLAGAEYHDLHGGGIVAAQHTEQTVPNTPEPRAAREFRVRYSTGQPPRSDQPLNNTFGLAGEGKLIVDATTLTFEGQRTGLDFGGVPKIALADVANVDYNARASRDS